MTTYSGVGLVNGALVEFHGFVRLQDPTDNARIFRPPKYMLVKIKDGPASQILFPNLPQGVVPMEPVEFTYREARR